MSICPWCKGKMPVAIDSCSSCGKNPAEHPSISVGGYGNFGAFDDFDEPAMPQLDVASPVQQLAGQHGRNLPDGDPFDDAPAASIKLEVDTAPVRDPPRRPMVPIRHVGDQPPLAAPTSYRVPGFPPSESQDAPVFDAYEIAVLAGYGPAPDTIWELPSYSLRVSSRRRELRRRLQLSRRSVGEAEEGRDDRLADLAERVRPAVEESNNLASLLTTLKQIENTTATRQDALAVSNDNIKQMVSVVDREIETRQKSQSHAKMRVDAAAKVLDEARVQLERCLAQTKRAEIELRNALDVARAAAGPQARTAPPEHATKIETLNQILAERRAAVSAPQTTYNEAMKAWNDADSAFKTVQHQIANLQKQRRTIEDSHAKELSMRSEGVARAELERREALVAVGARLIELNAPFVPQALRQMFFESQEVLSKRVAEAECLNQAILSADEQAVKKGWMVLVGGILLALVFLVGLIALLGRSEEPM